MALGTEPRAQLIKGNHFTIEQHPKPFSDNSLGKYTPSLKKIGQLISPLTGDRFSLNVM